MNGRSILLGLLGVLFICGLTPYNNYALNNTDLVGNFLPTGLLFFFAVFIFLVNAPLYRWAPRFAFSSSELAVALAMTLVSCTLPAGGLMRYLPGNLMGIISGAHGSHDNSEVLRSAIFQAGCFRRSRAPILPHRGQRGRRPTLPPCAPAGNRQSCRALGQRSLGRLSQHRPSPGEFSSRPCMALVAVLACIFRRQWVENERLTFPLASIYLSLIEAPEPGKSFNGLLRSKSFWIAFLGIFFVHALNALNKYNPRVVPAIPLSFDLHSIMSNPPLSNTASEFKSQTIYFTTVGTTYFVQSRTAFSLWFFFVLYQVVLMFYAAHQQDFTQGMQTDQFFGSLALYGGVMLWLARRHLANVAAQMIRGARAGDPIGRYLSYGVTGWGLLVCLAAMVIWLVFAGTTVAGGVVLVGMMMLIFLVVARVVAETGLI